MLQLGLLSELSISGFILRRQVGRPLPSNFQWEMGGTPVSFPPYKNRVQNYTKKCGQTTTQTCVQIYAHLRTNLHPFAYTTTGYFCTHNSSYLYAASPWSILALASPLMELWSYGYDGWIRCINRCRNHSQGLSNRRWDLVYWWVKISPLNEQNFTPEF